MSDSSRTCTPESTKRFYWTIVLPLQSLFLTVYAGPMYGFNALIRPINEVFSPDSLNDGWAGAFAGGTILLTAGIGGLVHRQLFKLAGGRNRLLIIVNLLLPVVFGLGALACYLKLFWLLLVGFAIPSGLIFANLFLICITYLVAWGQTAGRVGLSTGVFGMFFGFWGAIYSMIAPIVFAHLGVIWLLILSGIAVAVIQLLALIFMKDPPPAPAPTKADEKSAQAPPALTSRDVLKIPSYWVYGIFFLLFLTPGFGFKIIVSALTSKVFHVTDAVAAIIAAAFLISYGLSRLGFGILSDNLRIKPMYFMFSAVQVVVLTIAAIALPHLEGVVFFTVLLCITGAMFAAGKCLWSVVMVRIYGPTNFHTPMAMTQPFYGLAGFAGPLTLTWALRSPNAITATTWWLYAAAGALVICAILFHLLKRMDYDKFAAHEAQGLELTLRARSEFDRF